MITLTQRPARRARNLLLGSTALIAAAVAMPAQAQTQIASPQDGGSITSSGTETVENNTPAGGGIYLSTVAAPITFTDVTIANTTGAGATVGQAANAIGLINLEPSPQQIELNGSNSFSTTQPGGTAFRAQSLNSDMRVTLNGGTLTLSGTDGLHLRGLESVGVSNNDALLTISAAGQYGVYSRANNGISDLNLGTVGITATAGTGVYAYGYAGTNVTTSAGTIAAEAGIAAYSEGLVTIVSGSAITGNGSSGATSIGIGGYGQGANSRVEITANAAISSVYRGIYVENQTGLAGNIIRANADVTAISAGIDTGNSTATDIYVGAGATVQGGTAGIARSSTGTTSNSGTIRGGVGISSTAASTIENSGLIDATSTAVSFLSGGSLTNNVGASITSNSAGINVAGGAGTIDNRGTITVGNAAAILLNAGGTATNYATINASGSNSTGLRSTGAASTLDNRGTITANIGIRTDASGSTLNNSGTINATSFAIYVPSGTATLTNSGTVNGAIGATLNGGGSITNTGSLIGVSYGITSAGSATTVINSGVISGGSGAISLSTYDDTVTLNAGSTTTGSISLSNGNDTINIVTGATFGAIAGGNGTDTVALSGATTGTLNLAALTTFEILNKTGTGTWTLNGAAASPAMAITAGNGTPSGMLVFANSGLTGTIAVNGATIRATSAGAFGTGTITAIDPTIQYGGTGSYANNIVLAASDPVNDPTRLEADTGVVATLTGQISESGGSQPLVIGGGGTIVLTNAGNNWSGGTTIEAGATLQGSAAAFRSGNSVFNNQGTLIFDEASSASQLSPISGAGNMVKRGAGTLSLYGTNTYSGTTTIEAGRLALNTSNALGTSSAVALTGSTAILDASAVSTNLTLRNLSGVGGSQVLLSGKSATLSNSANTIFAGTLSTGMPNNTNLTKDGAGTLTLSGDTSGVRLGMYVANGTLALAGTASLANAAYVGVDSGSFDISGVSGPGTAIQTVYGNGGTVVLGSKTLEIVNASLGNTYAGIISGTGGLTLSGGFLTLGGANTYSGATTIANGAQFRLTGAGSVANSDVTANGVFQLLDRNSSVGSFSGSSTGNAYLGGYTLTIANGGNFAGQFNTGALNLTGGTLAFTGTGSLSSVALNGGNLVLGDGSASGDLYTSYVLTNGTLTIDKANDWNLANVIGGAGNVVKAGTGTLTLWNNSYTGSTTVNAGTLRLELGDALADTGALILNAGSTAELFGADETIGSLSGAGGFNTNGNQLTLTNGGNFAGEVSGNGGTLVIAGGTLTLTGDNSYTGGTTVSGGAVLTLGDGGTSGSVAGTIAVNGGALIVNRSDSVTIQGLSGNGGTFIQAGSGTTHIGSSASGFTGVTRISAGTLALDHATALQGSIAVGLTGASATLDLTGTAGDTQVNNLYGVAGSIVRFGNGGVHVTTTGNLTFGGTFVDASTNDFVGAAFDGFGALTLTGQSDLSYVALGDGMLAVADGGTLGANARLLITGGTFDVSNAAGGAYTVRDLIGFGGTVELGANRLQIGNADPMSIGFAGTIQGSGALSVLGGSFRLAGGQLYTGDTLIDSGARLALFGSGSFASQHFIANGTLDISAMSNGLEITTLTGNGTVELGAGHLALAGDGGTTGFAGTITGGVDGKVTIGSGTQVVTTDWTYGGQTTLLNGANLTIGDGGTHGALAGAVVLDGGTLTTDRADLVSVNGLSGTGTLTVAGSGETRLHGTGTFTGDVIVANGALTLADAEALAGSASLTLSAANAELNTGNDLELATVNNLSGVAGSTINIGRNVLMLNNDVATTFAGTLHSVPDPNPFYAQGIVKSGAGTLALTGQNTLVSAFIEDGTLALSGAGALGDSAFVLMRGGTLDLSALTGGATAIGSLNSDGAVGTVNLGATTLTITGSNLSRAFGGVILGSGGLHLTSNSATILTGTNGYSGDTVIDAGAILALLTSNTVPNSIGIPVSDASISNSGVTANGIFDLRGTFGQMSVAGLGGSGGVLLGDDWFRAGSNNADTSFSGSLSGGNGLFWKDGTGTLTLSGASDLSQLLVFDGTVALAGDASLGTNAEVGVVFGTFDISGINADSLAIADLSDFGSVQLGSKTLEITNGYQSYSGTIEGTGGVHISGGYGTFGGEQLYTGTTTIDAGASLYLVGFDGALTGAAQVDGTLDIDLHAGDTHIGGLSGTGAVLLGTNSLAINGGGSFSGIVSGDGGLTFAAGTSTLRGANTYAGTTTIDSGATLALAGTGTTGAGAVIANGAFDISGTTSGATIANLSGTGTVALGANTLTLGTDNQDSDFAGVIGGTGGLVKVGTGVLTLSSANTYTGLTQVADGTLRLGASGVLADDSTLEVMNGATLDLNGFDETVAAFTIQGNLIGSGTLTAALYNFLGGTIDHDLGGGAIHQISGTTLLNGSSAGSAVHVEGGTLMLGANERLADTAAVTMLAGATLDLQGYNETVGSLALAGTLGGSGTLTAGTYTLDSATVNANLGAGTLIQHSGLSYLNGTTATETVNITGGTLRLGGNDRIVETAAVGVVAGTTLDLQGFNDTVGSLALAGTLSGTGTLTASTYTLDAAVVAANLGAGTLLQHSGTSLLNGSSATETVNVDGGTLRLGGNDRLVDSAVLTVASGTVLDLQGFSDTVGTLALAGTLSGTGTLSAATYMLDGAVVNANLGAGSLIQHSGTSLLKGTTATATVNVDAGTLRLGASDRLADAAVVTVASGTTLDLQGFNDSVGSLALAGTLSGTGTLSATTYILDSATVNANLGAGTLLQHSGTSLLNRTTATATVNIDAGTLRLGASDRLADAAAVTVAAGTTLDLQGFNETVGTFALAGTLSGTGTLTAATYTLNGATIDANLGTGTLVQAGGTSVLHGSFAGSAAQINGGTLAFDRANATTYAGSFSGTGTLAQNGPGVLTLSGNSAAFTGTTNVSGGGLAVTGQLGGNVEVSSTLSGTGSIGGTVRIADGAHLVGATGSTLSMGALSLASGAMLDVTLAQPSTTALFAVSGDLTLDGTLNVTAQPNFGAGVYRLISYGGALTDNGLTLGTVTGAAAGGLSVQTGAVGQVNLVNTNGATLAFWDGGLAANHDNGAVNGGAGIWSATARNWTDANGNVNGAMRPVPSFAVFQGTGGAVTIDNGAGQVSATGLQFASNGYTLSGGALALSGSQATIRVGDGSAAGANLTATIASALTGSSALVKTDLGTLVLTGTNSYTGGTIVEAGALIGNAASIQSTVQNAGTVVFDQATNASFAGALSGAGSFVKAGAGALTLTGTSSSAWRITGGSLVSTSALFTGSVDIGQGTSFVFNQAANGTYAGTLTGSGLLLVQGGGTVLFTGNGAGFTGATSVAAGQLLSVNGTLGGMVNVAAGGRLQGSGTIGGGSIAGTIAPGNSIGTLSVTGNLNFLLGSSYEVEANASGQSDKIVVGGTATIANGSAVNVLAADGNYAINTTYTILTATGGVTGTFSSVTSNLAFLTPSLTYGANAVTLNLRRNTVDFASVAQTGNQAAIAPAIEALGLGNPVYDATVALTAAEARGAFDQLAGSDYASMRGRLLDDSRFVRDAVLARGGLAGEDGLSVWGNALGSWASMHGGASAQGYGRDLKGFLAGFDAGFAGHWRAGLATGYGTSELRTGNANQKAETYHAAGYLAGSYGIASIQLGAAYAWNDVRSQRRIAFGGFTGTPGDKYRADTFQAFGEVAVKGELSGVTVQPFAGLAYVDLKGSKIAEAVGPAALYGGTEGENMTWGTFGLRTQAKLDFGGTTLRFNGSAALRHAFGDTVPVIDLGFASGPGFAIAGNALDRDSASLDAGLELDLGKHMTLGISYTGSIAERATDHGARASLNWRF